MDDPLDLENRRRIHMEVTLSPGLHYRELQRRVDMQPGLLDHHLRYMVERDMLVERKEGHYTRYYVSNRLSEDQKRWLSLLRQEIPRAMVMYLLMNPWSCHKEILSGLKVSGATLSYHLKKMTGGGLVKSRREGRHTMFAVSDPDAAAGLLITYKKSFMDALVDAFVRVWTARPDSG